LPKRGRIVEVSFLEFSKAESRLPKVGSYHFSHFRAAIRYDTAHGYAHIDRFNLQGKRRKENLRLNFAEALTRAERDIKQNWTTYRERFLKGEFP